MSRSRVPGLLLTALIGAVPLTGPPQSSGSAGPGVMSPEAWREDIDFVVRHLVDNHANPFHTVSESDLRSAAERLKADADGATDAEMIVGLSRLVASIGDAHTYLRFPESGPLAFRALPVRFDWVQEGLIIAAAVPELARLVGAGVLSVDGTPAAEALARAGQALYRENSVTPRFAAPRVLGRPEALEAMGIAASADSVRLALRLRDGSEEDVILRPLSTPSAELVEPHQVKQLETPLYLRHRDRNFWYERIDEPDAHFVQFNVAQNAEDESIAAFAARLGEALAADPSGDVVVDVRWNIGGDSAATVPLVRTLVAHRERAPETRFFVITGRWSLSATIVFLGDLVRMLEPVLVGEPTGARPNLYGENPFSIITPHSGLSLTWATQYYQPFGPEPQPEAVLPAIAAEPTLESMLAGRDPALEAVRAYERYDLAGGLRTAYDAGGIDEAVALYEWFHAEPKYAYRDPFDVVRRFGRDVAATRATDTLAIYRLLLRDYPERARSYELMGSILEDLDRRDEARAHYEEALRRLDQDETVSRPLAYALRQWLRERLEAGPAER